MPRLPFHIPAVRFADVKKRIVHMSIDEIIPWGVGGIALLVFCIVCVAVYFFYTTVVRPPDMVSDLPLKRPLLSERDIDEVIRLLDAREEKVKAILNGQ